MLFTSLFCTLFLGSTELIENWREYLSKNCNHFNAEVVAEDYDSAARLSTTFSTKHKIRRDGDLWAVLCERKSETEDFMFARQMAASSDQICFGFHSFSSRSQSIEETRPKWTGFLIRNEINEGEISKELWDLGYLVGYFDRMSMRSAPELASKCTNIQLSAAEKATIISGESDGVLFRLDFSDHPCPTRMEFEHNVLFPNNEKILVNVVIDNILWESNAALPSEFTVRIDHKNKNEVDSRHSLVRVNFETPLKLDSKQLSLFYPPRNETAVSCLDIPSECVFRGGRIELVEPSRSVVSFKSKEQSLWPIFASVFAILSIIVLLWKWRSNLK